MTRGGPAPRVAALHRSEGHSFSKPPVDEIVLVAGLGVAGDAHSGARVKHRSRVQADPSQPNLRQVHLMHAELHDELRSQGHVVRPGDLGENVTTLGIDLLALPTGTILGLGADARVAVTGLRNPCRQIEDFQRGLLGRLISKDASGRVVRKAGIMAVVVRGGVVRVRDPIAVAMPPGAPVPLEPV